MAGYPYRVHVRWITPAGSFDVYPTIELIDRLYPPNQQLLVNFPILIELTADDLQLAVSGHMVSKVVYVEDAELPSLGSPETVQPWFDVRSDEDPMEVADHMGRPVALVRLGSRTPTTEGVDDAFLFGNPPVTLYGGPATGDAPPTASLDRSAPQNRPAVSNAGPGIDGAMPVAASAPPIGATFSTAPTSGAPTIWLSAGPKLDAAAIPPRPAVFMQIRDEAPSP
jgi:hypothetical protein